MPTASADDAHASLAADEFAARVVADNPHFAELDADVDVLRARVTGATLWPNPSLSYEREQIFPDSSNNSENTIAVGWSLDLSGRRSRNASSARESVGAATALADDAKRTSLVDALASFYTAAHARLTLDALVRGRAPLARMVDAVRARVSEGDAAGYDLARLELELASYDDRTMQARSELDAARRELGALVGEPDTSYDADDELSVPTMPTDVLGLTDEALATRGDYRATSHAASSADAAASAADRGWIPALDFALGFKTANLGTETATGYYAMISIELPLFSRGQDASERAQAKKRAALAHRSHLERAIRSDVQIARDSLAAAIARVTAFETEQLERANQLVGKAETIYDGGEGSVVELVDAYRTATDAELRYLDLRLRARAAELTLLRALGRGPELGS